MKSYSVIKKSAGYIVKNFSNEADARQFATSANTRNHTDDYIVCIKNGGLYEEI